MFFFTAALFYVYKIQNRKLNLIAKLQNSNRNFTFSWVSLIGFSTTWPEGAATLLGWPKSIYYFIIVTHFPPRWKTKKQRGEEHLN